MPCSRVSVSNLGISFIQHCYLTIQLKVVRAVRCFVALGLVIQFFVVSAPWLSAYVTELFHILAQIQSTAERCISHHFQVKRLKVKIARVVKYIRESAPILQMASYVAQIQSMNRRCFCKAFASTSLRVSLHEDNMSHGPLDWKLCDPFQHIHSCEDRITNIQFNSRLLIF